MMYVKIKDIYFLFIVKYGYKEVLWMGDIISL